MQVTRAPYKMMQAGLLLNKKRNQLRKCAVGHFSQAAKGIINIWWVKVMVPTKTLHILNAEVVLMTVWGAVSPELRDNMGSDAPICAKPLSMSG